MGRTEEMIGGLSAVPASALVTLYSRALESQTQSPILQDEMAVEITHKLNPLLSQSDDHQNRLLARGELKRILRLHIALRGWYYDQMARGFLRRNPDGVLVNLGCGMDTRFHRIDDGEIMIFDLDLPELIQFKRQFVEENGRYQMIPKSVFDFGWMNTVAEAGRRPVFFLAEGLLMYLEAGQVKELVLELQRRFPGCELLCEVFNSLWLGKNIKPLAMHLLQQQAGLGKHTEYHFGIHRSQDLESWGKGIEFLDDWTYFNPGHPKLKWLRPFGRLEIFRKIFWSVHYRLN